MTPTVTKRRVGRPSKADNAKLTFPDDFLTNLRAQVSKASRISFPSPRYRRDPVAFAREILGIEPWGRQKEILEAVRDNTQVAVRGGQKVGKSNTAAILALWYYCSYDDARVLLSATTEKQVERVLYRELRKLVSRSGRCVDCRRTYEQAIEAGQSQFEVERDCPRPCPHSQVVDGALGATSETGLQSGLRQIVGLVARNEESVAGISGAHQLWICDEASGMSADFLSAATGNLAGGGMITLISNPTRMTGFFYDCFHKSSAEWTQVHISAYDSPNVVEGRTVIEGLATRAYIEKKRQAHGETSAWFRVRVLGEFATITEARLFSDDRLNVCFRQRCVIGQCGPIRLRSGASARL